MCARTRCRWLLAIGVFGVPMLLAASPAGATGSPSFGDPLSGLTGDQSARFAAGLEAFSETEDVADGLGPVFNGDSCGQCHSQPAIGGASTRVEMRFGKRSRQGFDPMTELGGSLVQDQGIGVQGACTFTGEVVPASANVSAGRRTTALFGAGLIDGIPDQSLVALAAHQRRESPSTAGRVHWVTDAVSGAQRAGRFGWKSQVASLMHFSADAYLNEMGITTPIFPHENCPQGDCSLLACDPTPDPEDDGEDVVLFADFMSLLAPPPRAASALTRQVGLGQQVFARVGCADCHTPGQKSGSNEIAALANRSFAPYSDFLLHDMGSLGDGIAQGDAQPREMRTAPLWGVRALTTFLHDGRAATLEGAVLAHDGQGKAARERFRRLARDDKSRLLAFLGSL